MVSICTLSVSGKEPPKASTSSQLSTPWVLKAVSPMPWNMGE